MKNTLNLYIIAIERVEEESQSLLSEQNSENEFYDNSSAWKNQKPNRSYQNNILNSNSNSNSNNRNQNQNFNNSNKNQYKGQINENEKNYSKYDNNHRNVAYENIRPEKNKSLSTGDILLKSGKLNFRKKEQKKQFYRKIIVF